MFRAKIRKYLYVTIQGVIFILFCLLGKRKKYEGVNLSLCSNKGSQVWNSRFETYSESILQLLEEYQKGVKCSSVFQSVIDFSKDIEAPKILEIGFGRAGDLASLAKQLKGVKLYGAEFSDVVLHIGREVSALLKFDLELIKCDARYLPFKDNSFDIVYHQGLLEHFLSPVDVLKEQAKVLHRGGYLIISVPQLYHTYTVLKQAVMRVGSSQLTTVWETEYSARELSTLLTSCGLEIEEVVGRGSLFDNWTWRHMVRLLPRISGLLRRHLHRRFSVSIVIVGKKVRE